MCFLNSVIQTLGKVCHNNTILAKLRRFGLTENDLLRLHEEVSQFGIVSAYLNNLSRNENKQRHTELVQLLNVSGYSWEGTQGTWQVDTGKGYALENSCIVYDIPFRIILNIGEAYEQEAIIYKVSGSDVGLYDLNTRLAYLMEAYNYDMQAPRPRVKEDLGVEHTPSTRFRDVEIVYNFDWSEGIPFEDQPVTRKT